MPAPQFIDLVDYSKLQLQKMQLQQLEAVEYKPCFALLAVLKGPSSLTAPGVLKFTDHPVIETISDNYVKGISPVPAMTIHSSLTYAEKHLSDDRDAVAETLEAAASEFVDFEIAESSVHSWLYA